MDAPLLWAVLLLLLGAGLMVAEILLPSLGLLGVSALACVIASCWLAFQVGPVAGWTFVAVAAVGLPTVLGVSLKVFPDTRLGRRWILHGPGRSLAGGAGGTERYAGWLGRGGVALSTLRPAGIVEIDGERLDVVTEGLPVDRGREVVVVRVEGHRIVVRARE